jgi:pyruvate/2-oxoglutarate dehydrogenase complex dihydrolipoamide acyltransferase (E2) component
MSELAQIKVPAKFPNDETASVVAVYVATGDRVSAGAVAMDVEFSKATVEVECTAGGYISLCAGLKDEMPVGSTLAIIFSSEAEARQFVPEKPVLVTRSKESSCVQTGSAQPRSRAPSQAGDGQAARASKTLKPLFSASALARLKDLGLDQEDISGIDFVRAKDIGYALPTGNSNDVFDRSLDLPRSPFASEKVPPLKAAELGNLLAGQNAATSNFQRTMLIPSPDNAGRLGGALAGINNSSIVLRQCARLLKEFRYINAFYLDGQLNFYHHVNIGYAIDLGQGLRIANLGDLSEATDSEIKSKIVYAAKSYMTGKLNPGDIEHVTFVVTDLSNENVESFIPLLGKFQGATLGICSRDPASGSFKVSLTFDHRVTEGRMAARFLQQLAARLKQNE